MRREIPTRGGAFNVTLGPGDGRLYSIGPAGALAAVRNEVLKNRIDIERDPLELQMSPACGG